MDRTVHDGVRIMSGNNVQRNVTFYIVLTCKALLQITNAIFFYSVNYFLITVFLINVLRVILTIMHPNSANPAPMGVRRAARAALILVPLFGLQHILIPFRPEVYEPYEHLYQYVTVLIVSLQVSNK